MAGTSRSPSSNPPAKFSVKESQGFSYLRHLLLGPEQSQLERLATRLDSFSLQPHEVSRVLPDAIRLRAQQDNRLLASMVPVTQQALTLSIKESPHLISDSMAPIIGSAVRKATGQAMRTMMQSLHQTLDHSMSWRGLQWRWEAFRTGKSFAEVVLLHTLRFRVEQVFFIHKSTGLLLNHVVAEGVSGQGEDVISGMLTAIQDFVRDSFGHTSEEGLESLRIGDLTVWIEQGSNAIIAGVIRGTPPLELRSVFQETNEFLHAEYSVALQEFAGDLAPFHDARHYLEECLQAQFEKSRPGLPWIIWIVLGAILLLMGMWLFQGYQKHQRWEAFLERVGNVPGLVITSIQEKGLSTVFHGMRDPLSRNPEELIAEAGYSPQLVSFQLVPFLDLTPEFIQRRALAQLQPPDSVDVSWEGSQLVLAGKASHAWISRVKFQSPLLPGVSDVDTSQLRDKDLEHFETVVAKLESYRVEFVVGTVRFLPNGATIISDVYQSLQELDQQAKVLDIEPTIELRGYSSPEGTSEFNQALSLARARRVLAVLPQQQFARLVLRPVGKGVGSSPIGMQSLSPELSEHSRRVSFHVLKPGVKRGEPGL